MTAPRQWMCLASVLCLSGTAFAQQDSAAVFEGSIRMARLENPPPISPGLWSAAFQQPADQPVVRGPIGTAPQGQPVPQDQAPPMVPPDATAQTLLPIPNNYAANNYSASLIGTPWAGWCEGDGHCHGGYGSCGDCNLPSCCDGSHFFAYLGGIVMGRDVRNRTWTASRAGDPNDLLLRSPEPNWGGGVDVRLGYWFGGNDSCNNCCGSRCGIDFVYFGVWGIDGQSSITSVNSDLNTTLNIGGISFNGNAAVNLFDNSRAQLVSRNDELHNLELNFLYLPCVDPCAHFQLTALAGVRFLRFDEVMQFGALAGTAPAGATFANDPADAAYLNSSVQNNLVGFQIGAYMNYRIGSEFRIFVTPKIGIYGNHVVGRNELVGGNGTLATFDASGDVISFHNTTDVFSVLGSIDVGFNWAFTPTWSLVGGYRLLAASGVALGDNQIPQSSEVSWRTINTNGDLILHGAFLGAEARF
jgi:Putative beta barrel porin-7 (BBP7)